MKLSDFLRASGPLYFLIFVIALLIVASSIFVMIFTRKNYKNVKADNVINEKEEKKRKEAKIASKAKNK